jgi:hypothetical protein
MIVTASGVPGSEDCAAQSSFVGRRIAWVEDGNNIAGIASSEIARIVVVGYPDKPYPLRLSPDGGFIRAAYNCPALVALDGYDRDGKLVVHEKRPDW